MYRYLFRNTYIFCYGVFCTFSGESIHPYCERVKTGGLQTECTQQRDAMALCNLIDYGASLPAQYQVAAPFTPLDTESIDQPVTYFCGVSNEDCYEVHHLYSATSRIPHLQRRFYVTVTAVVQSKPAPTDFDLQPNTHTQPWSAV